MQGCSTPESISVYQACKSSFPSTRPSSQTAAPANVVTNNVFLDESMSSVIWEPSPALTRSRSTRSTCGQLLTASPSLTLNKSAVRCDKGVMTDFLSPASPSLHSQNLDLEAELFGKQVTLHLQKMQPYNREMSKLLMQQVMSHFSLVQNNCQPPSTSTCLGVGRSDFSQLFQAQLNHFSSQ